MVTETVDQVNDTVPYEVLIVDDDIAHRTLEKEILSGQQYKVYEAENGESALTQIKQHEFDVILLDKRMPGIDGDQVCARIRQDLGFHLLPVIMVTGTNSNEELVRSMNAGASDFIRIRVE